VAPSCDAVDIYRRLVMFVRNRGISLVELLVSMGLGVVLSAAMIVAYTASQRNYLYEQQVGRLQENGRHALRILSRELAMVGFYASVLDGDSIAFAMPAVDCSRQPWALDVGAGLDIVDDFDGADVPLSSLGVSLDCIDGKSVRPGTDLLAIKRSAASASVLRGVAAEYLTPSRVFSWHLRVAHGEEPRWEKRRPFDLIRESPVAPEINYWKAIARIFHVRHLSGSEPELCMETLAGDAMSLRCLVQGVEDLQLEFGIDSDGDGVANHFQSNPDAQQIELAVAARFHLLLRSVEVIAGYKDRNVYLLGQKRIRGTGDGRIRRVFSATIALDNRGVSHG
jgi:type IV pilus assembly protein PilW